ncbi:adhesion G-protein coupled receptor D1-like [Antedon mediterranea]|uniref:adhesion G-protein coupled receptor D1-like n=1 Tax=Antedon mediterranea TaxID=105859 RepID=UPI003AF7B495
MILWCTELYCKIRHPFADHQKRFKYFRVIGWMLPLVGVATVVGVTREEYASSSCWLNTSNRVIMTFIVPVASTILTVSVQLIVVFYEVHKKSTSMPTSEHDEHLKLKRLRSMSYRVLLLAPVVGLPWVTGFFVILDDSMYTQFIFIVSAAFQGLWIWISQFSLSREVRYAFRKHFQCFNNQISSRKTTTTITRTDLQTYFT